MSFFVQDKTFYKTLLTIAIPIALQNLLNFSVGMMDTIMLGALGETALSASSLANQTGFVFSMMVFGMGNAAMVLNAQYWGKQEMEPIRRIFGIALKLTLIAAVALTVVVSLFPVQVMRIFTPEPAVIQEGVRYLRVIVFTYVLSGYSSVLLIALRSIEVVRISILVSVVSLIVNVFLNYVLIFGHFGAPALGIVGAAIATVIARFCECVIVTVYLWRMDKRLQLKWKHILGWDKALLTDFFRHGTPVIFNEMLWSMGMAVHAMILGRLGEDAVAANSICSVVQQVTTVFVFGIANACGVIIGKTVGSGQYSLAMKYTRTLQVGCIGVGLLCAGSMLLLRDAIISIYNISAATQLLTKQFLTVSALVVFAQSYTFPTMVGILRGGGDARFVLLMDIIFVWGVTIPFGAVAGLLYGLPMPLVYLFLKCDEPIKILFSTWRLRNRKWIRNVTRAELS